MGTTLTKKLPTHSINEHGTQSTCTAHPAIPSQLPSTTLLCTQLTNTKHSWQNGTRCRDGVNVLWCCSNLVWLVFEGSIPTCTCFHLENFFLTCEYLGCTKFTQLHVVTSQFVMFIIARADRSWNWIQTC